MTKFFLTFLTSIAYLSIWNVFSQTGNEIPELLDMIMHWQQLKLPSTPLEPCPDSDGMVSGIITDVDGCAPADEQMRHVKKKGRTIVNEFFDPEMFPMIYPTLFLYGIGGFEDGTRTTLNIMQNIYLPRGFVDSKNIIPSCLQPSVFYKDERCCYIPASKLSN
jgi:hypothetical protein